MAAGSIRKLNGRYYIRTRVQIIDSETGETRWKQVEKAAGTSRKQAGQALKALQTNVDEGAYVPSSMTVLELGRKWLREHAQPELKPGTAASYKNTFYNHVAPTLGPIRLDDCKSQMVKELLGRKRAEGLHRETVAKIRRQMHSMFAYAQDAGLLTVNPASAPRKRGQKQRKRQRGTALSPAQVARFLKACSPRWRMFFTVALDTGLRRGELVGLRWGDVDLLDRVLYVRRSIGAYDDPEEAAEGQLTTKTEAGERLVPILDGAQEALEALYAAAVDTRDEAPVFATIKRGRGRDGVMHPAGRPINPRWVTRVYREAADRAGIPDTIRLHDLRHTAITNAINQGEDIALVALFAGHAKTSTTVDVYGHLLPKRAYDAARRMRSVSHNPSHKLPTNNADQPTIEASPVGSNPSKHGVSAA
jgi:integrase